MRAHTLTHAHAHALTRHRAHARHRAHKHTSPRAQAHARTHAGLQEEEGRVYRFLTMNSKNADLLGLEIVLSTPQPSPVLSTPQPSTLPAGSAWSTGEYRLRTRLFWRYLVRYPE
jgi:hypothetical protein